MADPAYEIGSQMKWPNGYANVISVSGSPEAYVYRLNICDSVGVSYDRPATEEALVSLQEMLIAADDIASSVDGRA